MDILAQVQSECEPDFTKISISQLSIDKIRNIQSDTLQNRAQRHESEVCRLDVFSANSIVRHSKLPLIETIPALSA
jgi:hypothetical protein